MESSPTVSDSPLQTNGKKKHTLIIAEAGINMQGSLLQAKRMVDAAVKADADIFKMQKYDPVRLLGPNSPFLLDAQSGQFSRLEYGEMSHYCSKKGIEFLVTLFHPEDIEMGEKYRFKRYKVASRSVVDTDLIKEIALTRKPVIMSCGMADNAQVESALSILANNDVTLLYCVCKYPTDKKDFDFTNMFKLWLRFRKPVGFSNHCPEVWPSVKAAGLGASVLENHFTMSRKLHGCDQASSLEPNELTKLVSIVRELDKVP